MPMIDVYATAGTFTDQHQLAADLAAAVMTVEQVPDIPMFRHLLDGHDRGRQVDREPVRVGERSGRRVDVNHGHGAMLLK